MNHWLIYIAKKMEVYLINFFFLSSVGKLGLLRAINF
jgi:hypothetical protein